MKQLILILPFITIILVGCSSEEQRDYTDQQKTAIISFIEKGARLQSLTSQGVNIGTFSSELASVTAAWDTLKNTNWPESFNDEKELVEKAIAGWNIVQINWNAKIKESEPYFEGSYDVYLARLSNVGRYFLQKGDTDSYRKLFNEKDKDSMIQLSMSCASVIFDDAKQRLYERFRKSQK